MRRIHRQGYGGVHCRGFGGAHCRGFGGAHCRGFGGAVTLALTLLACEPKTVVEMYVDGFQPKNVRFEVEDLGRLDAAGIAELDGRPDVDGIIPLPAGSCDGPCRVALVSVFVHNMGIDATDEPAPVVRLKSPPKRALRLPIAYRGGQSIDKGRIGRIRWAVEMWPEETALTATLSSSVQLVDTPPPPPPAPAPLEKGPTP